MEKVAVDQFITGYDGAVRGAIVRSKLKNTKKNTVIKRPLQVAVSLEPDQLKPEMQEPAHRQFGSKRLTAMNAGTLVVSQCSEFLS